MAASSFARFITNLGQVIKADAEVAAWVVANFGAGKVLTIVNGNVPVAQMNAHEMPALVLEVGDGDLDEIVLGGDNQDVEADGLVGIVWSEVDAAKAFTHRLELPDIIARALLRNRTLNINDGNGDAVAGCKLEDWVSDRGDRAHHPRHFMTFTVRGYYNVVRT